jgi:hypothetical protein
LGQALRKDYRDRFLNGASRFQSGELRVKWRRRDKNRRRLSIAGSAESFPS